MPKIRMLKTVSGCADGVHAKEYVAGECYDVNDSLANDFASLDACEAVGYEPESAKAESAAPKNKAHKSAPKNKSELGD
jgi:hypothetical protein